MIKAVRGTRDLLPPDTELWNFVDHKVREVFARYNYHEIRTPLFESTELFARGVGEETDIVSKEMFTWEDKARAATNWDAADCFRSSTTLGRSSGANAPRRDVTASSIRSVQKF